MKAKRIQFDKFGDASEMYIGEFELPQLKPDEVQVKVKAAAVNPLDWKQRIGAMKLIMDKKFPKGIGNDFSGIIEAVGGRVKNFKVGDEVFGTMDTKQPGAFAESLITPAKFVTKKPSRISFAEAACLPIPAATAWAALFVKGNISTHSRVLINGCMGTVGSAAVQLSKITGAFIAGTCSEKDMEKAAQLGIDAVFNYNDKNYRKNAKLFDVVFDTSGQMELGFGFSMLKFGGKFIDINLTPKRILRGLFSSKYKITFATAGMNQLEEFAKLADQKKLKVNIGKEITFENAIDILTRTEKGEKFGGRIIINI